MGASSAADRDGSLKPQPVALGFGRGLPGAVFVPGAPQPIGANRPTRGRKEDEMSTHTPGPWHATAAKIMGGNNRAIATMENRKLNEGFRETYANACLIVAAP